MRVLASLSLAGLAAAPAQAAFPGQNGKIVYDGGHNVWVANPDGTGKQQLTVGGGRFEPTFDAQGQRIAFASGGFIWVMNADGSSPRNVTGPINLPGGHPAFSPDGQRIAFHHFVQGSGYRIFVVNVDGTNPVQVTDGPSGGDFNPAWSPDGSRIAYTQTNNSGDIFTVDPSQPGVETPYVGPDREVDDQPNWSPDGSSIAFMSGRGHNGRHVYVAVGAGSTPRAVTAATTGNDEDPAFSPDGTQIAFSSNRSGSPHVWKVAATGLEQSPFDVSAPAIAGSPDWGVLPPPPAIGKTLDAAPVKGKVLVAVPAGAARAKLTFVPLTGRERLPIGTQFDTTHGTVHLTFAATRAGTRLQSGNFDGGRFQTRQSRTNPLTEMRLTETLACKSGARGRSVVAARRRSRSLFANAHGRFRTRGRNSTATVRGTQWLTKDTCAGTLTVVKRGTVVVRDLRKRKTVKVKAGHRYFARARR